MTAFDRAGAGRRAPARPPHNSGGAAFPINVRKVRNLWQRVEVGDRPLRKTEFVALRPQGEPTRAKEQAMVSRKKFTGGTVRCNRKRRNRHALKFVDPLLKFECLRKKRFGEACRGGLAGHYGTELCETVPWNVPSRCVRTILRKGPRRNVADRKSVV